LTDHCIPNFFMHCTFHCIYRQLQSTHFMHCHISFYLQITAYQNNKCIATFHYIYRQLQTNWLYAISYFIVFRDNCSPNQNMLCYNSFYLQTTTDELNICNAIFHFIYRQLQTKWIYECIGAVASEWQLQYHTYISIFFIVRGCTVWSFKSRLLCRYLSSAV